MKIIFALAVLVLLTGCATAPPPVRPSDEQWKTAVDEAAKCAATAIQRLDDGVTSADVIARRVASECAMQDRKSAALLAEHWGFPQSVVFDAMNNSYRSAVGVDTDLILQSRAEANRFMSGATQ